MASGFKGVLTKQVQSGLIDGNEPPFQDGIEKAVLVFEIVMNHGHVDIRNLHYFTQGRGRHAVLTEQPFGGVQQQNAGFFTLIQAITFVSHSENNQLTNLKKPKCHIFFQKKSRKID
ncbi:MAG: hypothetical protein OSB55_10695 [Verrucomicrobiota bacterium]|nr:hypothetical protein [Verrucomicrobiota bacterium]